MHATSEVWGVVAQKVNAVFDLIGQYANRTEMKAVCFLTGTAQFSLAHGRLRQVKFQFGNLCRSRFQVKFSFKIRVHLFFVFFRCLNLFRYFSHILPFYI